jgi:hypothetical protein
VGVVVPFTTGRGKVPRCIFYELLEPGGDRGCRFSHGSDALEKPSAVTLLEQRTPFSSHVSDVVRRGAEQI